jgi:hypothetical protein
MTMAEKDVLYHELLEALQAEGCAVCRLARGASNSYIRALIHEGVTDVKLREALRDARGLCYRHGWRLAGQRGAVLGTAIIYQDVVNTLVRALEANAVAPGRRFGRGQPDLARALSPSTGCPACVLERDAEARTARVLLSHIDDATLAEAYKRAGGICLPHFQLALGHSGSAAVKLLAAWQAEAWSQLRGELDELIRKHDYRFRSEPVTDAEADSWERAVAAVVGEAEPKEPS